MSLMHQSIRFAIAVASLAAFQIAGAAEITKAEDLKDVRLKGSYALGVRTAQNWADQGANIDWDAFLRGVRDAEAGGGTFVKQKAVRDGRYVSAPTWREHPDFYREVFVCLNAKVPA